MNTFQCKQDKANSNHWRACMKKFNRDFLISVGSMPTKDKVTNAAHCVALESFRVAGFFSISTCAMSKAIVLRKMFWNRDPESKNFLKLRIQLCFFNQGCYFVYFFVKSPRHWTKWM